MAKPNSPDRSARPSEQDFESFFARHLEGVAARLACFTDKAVERQRAAWREALHREAVLDDKQTEPSTHH